MPEEAVRFSVSNQRGLRSATWVCFAQTQKDDVYLSCREFRGAMKFSFHEKGKWHLGFDKEFLDRKAPENSPLLRDRFPIKWREPKELYPGIILAIRIIVPEYTITVPKKEERKPLVWVPSPPLKKAVETSILLTNPEAKIASWPGANTLGTSLIGKIELESGRKVWVVHRIIDVPPLRVPSSKAKVTIFRNLTSEEKKDKV